MFEAGVNRLSPSRELKTRPSFVDAMNTPQRAFAESLSPIMRSISFVRTGSEVETDGLLRETPGVVSDLSACGSFDALVASNQPPINTAVAVSTTRKRRALIILKQIRNG